ncbi:MAG TPA: hypothetical protein VFC81_00655, partial [Verrucomicrobiae bacterium]|nr:hypothetical protein [Verrucomicrobiae bacterium]
AGTEQRHEQSRGQALDRPGRLGRRLDQFRRQPIGRFNCLTRRSHYHRVEGTSAVEAGRA